MVEQYILTISALQNSNPAYLMKIALQIMVEQYIWIQDFPI